MRTPNKTFVQRAEPAKKSSTSAKSRLPLAEPEV